MALVANHPGGSGAIRTDAGGLNGVQKLGQLCDFSGLAVEEIVHLAEAVGEIAELLMGIRFLAVPAASDDG